MIHLFQTALRSERSALQLLLLLAGTNAFAATSDPTWRPEDTVTAERITDVELSPADPTSLLWVKSAPDKEKDAMVSQIFHRRGDKTVQLTRGKNSCNHPRFSPDGQRVAFLSDRPLPKEGKGAGADDEAKTQIWLLDEGDPYPLTSLTRDIKQFAWRDTNRIVFIAQELPTERELRFKEEKDKSTVVEDEENEPPARLFEVDLQTRRIRRLTTNTDRITSLSLSPDGRYAVTFHDQSLRFEYDNAVRPQTFLTDLQTGERRRIFAEPRFVLAAVVWEPDSAGFYVVNNFTTHPKYLQAYVSELWHRRISDGQETAVPLDWDRGLAVFAGPGNALVALPDGVLTLLVDGVQTRLARYTRTEQGWDRQFVTGATDIAALHASRTRAGQGIAYTQTSADRPPQLFTASLGKVELTGSKQVTDLNSTWKDKPKAAFEVVHWTGARNETVEGLLYAPQNVPHDERRPLVLIIHGGPFGAHLNAWSDGWGSPIQLHCQRGAYVLCANYHGSYGYGLPFAQSISGGKQYYDLPVEDLERGVDALIEKGLVDPERIGTLGWSNGAILTLALITRHPDRYKAAASGAGGFEWVADTSVTAFGQAFNDYYFGKMPYEDPELYRSVAPYYQADRIVTPLIIFHGDADTSVPVHHGWMQFRALQQRTRTPVRFVLFPGENHGLKKLTSHQRKIEEELAWFDRYLYKTNSTDAPWLKDGSPVQTLLARSKAKRVGTRFGQLHNGQLIPETMRFQGMQVGRFEITQAQFAQFDSARTVAVGRENFPVTDVSFEQAQAYCAWLSQQTGSTWRLPHAEEAEQLYKEAGDNENTLDAWAGYPPNLTDSRRLLDSVRPLGPGALLREVGSSPGRGDDPIFDLGGNAAEWVQLANGKGQCAGGSAALPKDSFREHPEPSSDYIGFRVVRE